jgi:nitroreductase
MAEPGELLLDDPWQVRAADFPYGRSSSEKLTFLINYAALAPSILNSQPWTFAVDGDELVLSADRTRVLPVVDPDGRQLLISCGAALFNLLCALRSFGCAADVAILPRGERETVARVRLSNGSTPAGEDETLRDAIVSRRTFRRNFEDRALPEPLKRSLADAAQREGATLFLVERPDQKRQIAELVGEAERDHLSRPEFRQELSTWITRRFAEAHAQDSEALGRLGAAGHTPEPLSPTGLSTVTAAAAARSFASTEEAAQHQRDVVASSPVLALLTTHGDDPSEWVAAGQALQRVLLIAASAGVSASYLNPVIEVARLRGRVTRLFEGRGEAQIALRLGYAPDIPPSPRRKTKEVVSRS